MRPCELVSLPLLLAVICGCGSSDSQWRRVHVTGSVTYEGQPVQDGSVTFRPAAGTTGPAAGASIVNGRYEIPKDEGPALGKYQALLTVVLLDGPRVQAGPREVPEMRRFEAEVEFHQTEEQADFALPLAPAEEGPTNHANHRE